MISDPIEFELFKNSLFSIADEMALTIFRTTYSGVLKDNMDYSTAMFDGSGKLAAQGLTLPGHLGSMPTAMAAIQEAFAGKIEPGDVFILNDPFQGGMHLPDIFVFKPIFAPTLPATAPTPTLAREQGGKRGGKPAEGMRRGESSFSPMPAPCVITRMSAAACRARTRRIRPRSSRKGCASRRSSCSTAGFATTRSMR
jgi:hypothetical protein